jgi:hypothetical protein
MILIRIVVRTLLYLIVIKTTRCGGQNLVSYSDILEEIHRLLITLID